MSARACLSTSGSFIPFPSSPPPLSAAVAIGSADHGGRGSPVEFEGENAVGFSALYWAGALSLSAPETGVSLHSVPLDTHDDLGSARWPRAIGGLAHGRA